MNVFPGHFLLLIVLDIVTGVVMQNLQWHQAERGQFAWWEQSLANGEMVWGQHVEIQ